MSMAPVIDYGTKRPLGERINFRLLAVALVFGTLIGIPVYQYIRIQSSHGIIKNGDRFDVDLKKLGNFTFNEYTGTADNVPPDSKTLDGKEVALEGFMYTGNNAGEKVNAFQLVYNIQKCCFSGPPLVQERVFAMVPHGGMVDNSSEEVRVIGTLHLALDKDPDTHKTVTVFTMDVKRTEPL